ncbi:unnamed protein product [Amoebophrya sp. A120]|nr:unnamed protein product [Amoebophrya sp. A120]CAD7962310.1 unnamed protein product [Amoebophrya sp. A120]|eukprot:GSA120T00008966001.1
MSSEAEIFKIEPGFACHAQTPGTQQTTQDSGSRSTTQRQIPQPLLPAGSASQQGQPGAVPVHQSGKMPGNPVDVEYMKMWYPETAGKIEKELDDKQAQIAKLQEQVELYRQTSQKLTQALHSMANRQTRMQTHGKMLQQEMLQLFYDDKITKDDCQANPLLLDCLYSQIWYEYSDYSTQILKKFHIFFSSSEKFFSSSGGMDVATGVHRNRLRTILTVFEAQNSITDLRGQREKIFSPQQQTPLNNEK